MNPMNGGSSPRIWFGSNAVTVRSSKSALIRARLLRGMYAKRHGSPAPDLFPRLRGLELSNNALPLCTGWQQRKGTFGWACRYEQNRLFETGLSLVIVGDGVAVEPPGRLGRCPS